MTVPQITAVRLGGSPRLPLLVLGPSAGSTARDLWSPTARHLAEHFEVLAWDLPGHGSNSIVAEPFTTAELAAGVLEMVDDMLANRGELHTPFVYGGDSIGGAVGLHLLVDSPDRIDSAVLTGTVTDDDVRARLAGITTPVLAIASAGDAERLQEITAAVRSGQTVAIDEITGKAPLEAPAEVARLILAHVAGDVVIESISPRLTAEIVDLAAQHDETILARPGLDPRSRSIAALTAAALQGRHDDLRSILAAARANGLTDAEIRETLLQTALHSGVTEVAAALAVADETSGWPYSMPAQAKNSSADTTGLP